MVDVSKIKVGDRLTLKEAVVKRIEPDGAYPIIARIDGDGGNDAFSANAIATHTPAPRAFAAGDSVKHVDTSFTYEFLARFGGKAVIGRLDSVGYPCVTWANENDLRHAKAPADEIVVTDEDVEMAKYIFATTPGYHAGLRAALVDFLKRRKEAGR